MDHRRLGRKRRGEKKGDDTYGVAEKARECVIQRALSRLVCVQSSPVQFIQAGVALLWRCGASKRKLRLLCIKRAPGEGVPLLVTTTMVLHDCNVPCKPGEKRGQTAARARGTGNWRDGAATHDAREGRVISACARAMVDSGRALKGF